jgi:hydrogenase/urease accessory protein HupE
VLALVACLTACSAPSSARAHALDPALLEIVEHEGGRCEVTWRSSLYRARGTAVEPMLPTHCRRMGAPVATESPQDVTVRWTVDCGPGGLIGQEVGFRGLGPARTDALVRVELADGRLVRGVVRASEPTLKVPKRPRRFDVLLDYGRLGVAHILGGPDHLLFVLGLVLLVPGWRRLLATVTAFTLGHSITLSAATLDLVHLPSRLAELLIAMTVLALAVELSRAPTPSALRRRPAVMAAAFGLLHGLGFAAALREIGLPGGEIPLALLAFNAGVEGGQLIFIAVVLASGRLLVRLPLPRWAAQIPVYAMGSLAALWCFERIAALIS